MEDDHYEDFRQELRKDKDSGVDIFWFVLAILFILGFIFH